MSSVNQFRRLAVYAMLGPILTLEHEVWAGSAEEQAFTVDALVHYSSRAIKNGFHGSINLLEPNR